MEMGEYPIGLWHGGSSYTRQSKPYGYNRHTREDKDQDYFGEVKQLDKDLVNAIRIPVEASDAEV